MKKSSLLLFFSLVVISFSCTTGPSEKSIAHFLKEHYWIYGQGSTDTYVIEKCELRNEEIQSSLAGDISMSILQEEFQGWDNIPIATCDLRFELKDFPQPQTSYASNVTAQYAWLPVTKRWLFVRSDISK